MPLYQTISESESTRIYIWKVEESEDLLAENIILTENSKQRVAGMRSEIHRRGYLSIRHLLAEAGYTDNDLFYDEAGKPHLKDDSNISITHSGIFTGIIVSNEKEVGIDIEKQRKKIIPIAHKFTPIKEYKAITNAETLIRKLTVVWGAKESLYKIYATKGLSFLNHIYIHDFTLEALDTTGIINFFGERSSYDIDFLEFDGYTCVYALKRSNE
ncbi:MAG: 4'-phosphopantetheinyl transferase superfamily protein [Bacteroidia bacterium]|nr:4'-phosphopantetheinyl transferase superfamily protein [Bacteroidia bacterium]